MAHWVLYLANCFVQESVAVSGQIPQGLREAHWAKLSAWANLIVYIVCCRSVSIAFLLFFGKTGFFKMGFMIHAFSMILPR